jgi:DNA-binding transcriptional MerR regulator
MIGEISARLGVSERALRLYEARGLIQPARTSGGRRVYGRAELSRLHLILALKSAGCSLTHIAAVLSARLPDPLALLDMQITALESQSREAAMTLIRLKSVREELAKGEDMSVAALCDLIRMSAESMNMGAWQQVFDRYYTPEDMAVWAKVKSSGVMDERSFGASWQSLIGRIEQAMASGDMPDAPAAMALAVEWHALQRPMLELVGTKIWSKAARMYAEMDQWQTETVRAPFSLQVYEFAKQATAAAREAGLLAPSMFQGVQDE